MRLLLALILLFGAAALALQHLPPEWDPWKPLDFRADPGLVTSVKLWRLSREPEACFAAFAASGVPVVRVPDRPSDANCTVENAVRLRGSLRITPNDPVVTCRMAAAWTLFERHALQPLARRHFRTGVAGVHHLGTYNCRNVNHAAVGRRSEHAAANAIDIASFMLQDGRQISVARHWSDGSPESAFLHEVRDGACRWFSVVLGPDHNAAHANHFHFDMGPWSACR